MLSFLYWKIYCVILTVVDAPWIYHQVAQRPLLPTAPVSWNWTLPAGQCLLSCPWFSTFHLYEPIFPISSWEILQLRAACVRAVRVCNYLALDFFIHPQPLAKPLRWSWQLNAGSRGLGVSMSSHVGASPNPPWPRQLSPIWALALSNGSNGLHTNNCWSMVYRKEFWNQWVPGARRWPQPLGLGVPTFKPSSGDKACTCGVVRSFGFTKHSKDMQGAAR